MKRQTILIFLAAMTLSACGKDVEQLLNKYGNDLPDGLVCTTGPRMRWRWQQPEATLNRVVDLLFVADTSLSLLPERGRLAKTIPNFLSGLPADNDTRIGVMLAHGSGHWNGRLHSAFGKPRVIDPKYLGSEAAQDALHSNLCNAPLEFGVGNGEMLLHSLLRSLETDRFMEAKKEGFFRDNAALSVVFVTDENDTCYKPQDHGYKTFPHFNANGAWLEDIAYDAHCLDGKGMLRVTPEAVMSTLQDRFPGRRVSLAGIVHDDPDNVKTIAEDSIGHGIIETVNQTADGIILNVRNGDYEAGLKKLATVASTQVALLTTFELIASDLLDPLSILILVDGRPVKGEYDPATKVVRIRGADAGGALSRIDISACPQ